MKISFLIVLLLALACSSTQIEPECAVAQETKTESLEVDDQELSSEIVSAETVSEETKTDVEETPLAKESSNTIAEAPKPADVEIPKPVIETPKPADAEIAKPVLETPKPADVEIAKAEPVPEKPVNMKAPEEKALPVQEVKVIPQIEEKAPEKLLKLKSYKKLFRYDETTDSKNYIYAAKYTNVEVDGQPQVKIKLNSSGLYINLPIARKLKSGKYIVSAIITLNNKTTKLEFNLVSGKNVVDFALSSNSLKQF